MPIIGLNLTTVEKYESDLDPAKGTKDATVWRIGALDSRVQGMLRDKATSFMVSNDQLTAGAVDTVEASMAANAAAYERVQFGLRGWDRFQDATGADIPFRTVTRMLGSTKYSVVPDALMSLIPSEVIGELSDRIRKLNEVTVEEKNA